MIFNTFCVCKRMRNHEINHFQKSTLFDGAPCENTTFYHAFQLFLLVSPRISKVYRKIFLWFSGKAWIPMLISLFPWFFMNFPRIFKKDDFLNYKHFTLYHFRIVVPTVRKSISKEFSESSQKLFWNDISECFKIHFNDYQN